MTATVWQPGSNSIAVNAENASLIQKFIATAGQTIFDLTQFTYVVGTGSIRVYRNGVKLEASIVEEDSTTRFSLPTLTLLVGEVIECAAVLGSQDAVTAAAISAAASAAAAAASAASIAFPLSDSLISHLPEGVGAVVGTVETQLRELTNSV